MDLWMVFKVPAISVPLRSYNHNSCAWWPACIYLCSLPAFSPIPATAPKLTVIFSDVAPWLHMAEMSDEDSWWLGTHSANFASEPQSPGPSQCFTRRPLGDTGHGNSSWISPHPTPYLLGETSCLSLCSLNNNKECCLCLEVVLSCLVKVYCAERWPEEEAMVRPPCTAWLENPKCGIGWCYENEKAQLGTTTIGKWQQHVGCWQQAGKVHITTTTELNKKVNILNYVKKTTLGNPMEPSEMFKCLLKVFLYQITDKRWVGWGSSEWQQSWSWTN